MYISFKKTVTDYILIESSRNVVFGTNIFNQVPGVWKLPKSASGLNLLGIKCLTKFEIAAKCTLYIHKISINKSVSGLFDISLVILISEL